jgi:hypothetical protein
MVGRAPGVEHGVQHHVFVEIAVEPRAGDSAAAMLGRMNSGRCIFHVRVVDERQLLWVQADDVIGLIEIVDRHFPVGPYHGAAMRLHPHGIQPEAREQFGNGTQILFE